MLINLGTDVHGKNLGWDTSTGTPLTITGPDGSGKTILLDSIIRQADLPHHHVRTLPATL